MAEEESFMTKVMASVKTQINIPTCLLCGKTIIGAHIDYINKDRSTGKVCTPCIYQALDFYINEKEKRLGITQNDTVTLP